MTDELLRRVRNLLNRAHHELPDPAARQVLAEALGRLDEPLRVAIAGKLKAGKSTLLNAMVGEELAPTDAGECTRIVTWYRDGPSYRVLLHLVDGPPEQRPFDRVSGAVRVDLGRPVEEVRQLTVEVPSRRLREHTLIDTPGIASLSTEVSLRTQMFLAADEERVAEADAVVYLLRHMHGSDLRFLESFHGDELARGSPVNAVGVLSRADEIGDCRLDAMEVAARVADRYQSDERLRRLCPIVVPVAGLLGAAGATLREDEFQALATIAGSPLDDVLELLLTADRFVGPTSAVPVDGPARRRLLARLGLFGVRLSVQLIREGTVRDAGDLVRELSGRSGLDRLREVLAAQFLGRARVLKARSALAALDTVVRSRRADSGTAGLIAEAEEIRAGFHEFVEVRLLHLLRSGRLPGRPDQLAEMDRLLGGAGAAAADRLGLAADAVPGRLAVAAEAALARWQRVAEHPLSARELRTAARATVRSCEGILAGLHRRGPDPATR
ncbi:dynamin family protein [Plantactinospora sonchi]|uniref:Dynamin family protein n=1 Tax=Plantactinospora sonchi TaxID=1544735 RepID=A0ABU7RR27_9ACTN